MKYGLEITIRKDGLSLSRPGGGEEEFLPREGVRPADVVAAYRDRKGITDPRLVIFIAEECLFVKKFELPAATADLREAIGYQLALLTPFAEEAMLSGHTATRSGGAFQIMLVAAARQPAETYARQLVEAGYTIVGIFPASQRYVTKGCPKGPWGLVLPGRFHKVLLFNGSRWQDLVLCGGAPDFTELSQICSTATIYHPRPPAGESRFLAPGPLLSHRPLLKEFNLLPASYRKRDYSKMIISGLLALNLAAFLGLAGGKIHQLRALRQQVEAEIAAIMPLVRETNRTRAAVNELTEKIDRLDQLGGNPDLISLLATLTDELPRSAYLEMIRTDKQSRAIVLQGYTDDIATLTTKLQALRGAQLKSTSRRRDQTFFHMEIPSP